MKKITNIGGYVAYKEDTILVGLQKINENKNGFVIITEEDGTLVGTLTDGDVRRYITSKENVNFDISLAMICNRNCAFAFVGSSKIHGTGNVAHNPEFYPVVSKKLKVEALMINKPDRFTIGTFEISETSPCFIIAEIGNNHNGDLNLAKTLIDEAISAGAHCVKFQMRNMEALYKLRDDDKEDLGAQYTLELLDKFQLKDDHLFSLFDYCHSLGVVPLCTPWDEVSLSKLVEYGMPAFKVASADMTNHILLEKMIAHDLPLVISTGMSTDEEILATVDFLNQRHAQFALLHCNSTYPAPFNEINLKYMNKLKEMSNPLIGYSGHERGIAVSIAAVALGARIVERHITLDKNSEGSDHKVSLLPSEFKEMVLSIKQVEAALIGGSSRHMSQGELINREVLGKSLYLKKDISKGRTFAVDDFGVTSPGSGIQPYKLVEILGRKAKKDFKKGSILFSEDLKDNPHRKSHWKFKLEYGIPVRYHDFKELYSNANFEVVEFHLSCRDLNLKPENFLDNYHNEKLIIHCPELFERDHILDLVSDCIDHRKLSHENLEKTITHTLEIQKHFPQTKNPLLIVNVGGYSENGFKSENWKEEKYGILGEVLNQYVDCGVELLPQTMPPFPWHFGGQRFHNLLVDVNEIVEFCRQNNNRICLDISHTMLACNLLKLSLDSSLHELQKYTAHLHIADAKGAAEEGLQIGSGDIPFTSIWPLIEANFQSASFVPEVWQGHKNKGEGFWRAFDALKQL